MTIFGYLVLIGAVLYFIAIILFGVLKTAGHIAQSTGASISNLILVFPLMIRKVLGRGRVAATPLIDPRITPEADPYMRQKEIQNYANYSPKIIAQFALPTASQPKLELGQPWVRGWWSNDSLNIDDLKKVLGHQNKTVIEMVNKAQSALTDYPVPPPTLPPEIEPPMAIKHYTKLDIPEPTLDLPLWDGWLKFLNRYVYAQYDRELRAVKGAKQKRLELLEREASQVTEIQTAYEKALSKFKKSNKNQQDAFNTALMSWQQSRDKWNKENSSTETYLRFLLNTFEGRSNSREQADLILKLMSLPDWMPREFETRFDSESEILIIEHEFPDIGRVKWAKTVELKSGMTEKPLNQKELKQASDLLYPTLAIRILHELSKQLKSTQVKAIVINGWANYTIKATGNKKRAYCVSLLARVDYLRELNLTELDPVAAFNSMRGVVARSLELTPIAPSIRLNTQDSRFVEEKEILGKLSNDQNLASMDWEDFEHLCRELFERVFASSGAVVKVTQASRDQGVDAIIFDPDPIRGGKIVIQAKRYVNTVDVSSVRDLWGTVMNEGAMKGILVTTSQFGEESYSFAEGKPLKLIGGAELLGLLDAHGYKYRINLEEAKQMLKDSGVNYPTRRPI